MGALLASLVLSQVALSDEGGPDKVVRHINCVGAGVTCSAVSTFGTLTVTGGGSGLSPIACGTAQAVGSDGGVLYCVPTLSEPYGGTGAGALTCASGQALTSNGTAYSCTGTFAAGGSPPQVQWNHAGLLDGMSRVETDGTRLSILSETAYPATPATNTLHMDYRPSTSFPPLPMTVDNFTGLPMPIGVQANIFTPMASSANWLFQGHIPDTWGASTIALNWGETSSLSEVCASHSTNAWDNTTFKGRLRLVGCSSSAATFNVAEYRAAWAHSSRGSASGAGGFVVWTRTFISSNNTKQRVFIGLIANVSALTGTPEPSSLLDTVYIGCDNVDTTLHACSNDNVGSATCNDLGSDYPCKTTGAGYEVKLSAAANASAISYDVQRIDSLHETTGIISSDLPRSTVQLSSHSYMSSGDGGTAVRQDFGGMEMLDNW